jgi:hypothetical protein
MPGFPNGHFYSPVIDSEDLRRRAGELWREKTSLLPGVDLALDTQRAFLEDARLVAGEYDYKASRLAGTGPHEFHDGNGLFESLDSRSLYCMLRGRAPAKMIEVGSGYSSLLSADVNRRFLGGRTEIACIEPYPPDFLSELPAGISELIPKRVEEVGVAPFLALQAGDFLFIDSSHVSKTGSDVNFLYLEVLPRLASGVIVHLHDIFLPDEYPRDWVLEEERSWNEQYLLQALLIHSRAFRVLFASHCASLFLADQVESVFGSRYGGGSFWMEKIL